MGRDPFLNPTRCRIWTAAALWPLRSQSQRGSALSDFQTFAIGCRLSGCYADPGGPALRPRAWSIADSGG
jgi:hypothetical protein